MATPAKPLSPFWIYRWEYSMALSIAHRIAGIAMSVSALLLVYWLAALASGPDAYVQAQKVLGHPIAIAVFIGASLAFFYHLLNGIRHLFWDVGYGFERKVARTSGWVVALAAIVLTAACWLAIRHCLMSGGAQ